MRNVPTPHIEARQDDFGKTVLMPGDPLRAKFIAEKYLSDRVLVNGVRGVNGYTGLYRGKTVSVMASGMGMPSIGIYSYELFNFYGVENIIRVGSAGAIADGVRLRDIVLAMGACTNGNFAAQYELPGTYAPIADFGLLRQAADIASEMRLPCKVGNVLSSDVFYDGDAKAAWKKMGVLAVEMECAALYMTAARAGKRALCVCTISDCPFTGEGLSSGDRQTSFTDMMELALEVAAENA